MNESPPSSFSPTAIGVLAHLRLLETKRDLKRRLHWKLTLTKRLYQSGRSKREIIDLYLFLDWLIFLPQDFQQSYNAEMTHFEEERKMKYVSSIERQGIEKGLQQGLQQTSHIALRYLAKEFGDLDMATTAAIKRLPLDRLTVLSNVMFEFKSASELATWLSQNANAESVALSN